MQPTGRPACKKALKFEACTVRGMVPSSCALTFLFELSATVNLDLGHEQKTDKTCPIMVSEQVEAFRLNGHSLANTNNISDAELCFAAKSARRHCILQTLYSIKRTNVHVGKRLWRCTCNCQYSSKDANSFELPRTRQKSASAALQSL